MYKKIYVPLDNSEHSNSCVELSLALAKRFDAQLVGSHAYAAKMHDIRFKQMEYTLPEEYQDEQELERQRKIHDSLITMGLQLISDSYLELLGQRAEKEGLVFEKKMRDGKNFQVIVEDVQNGDYDLVVMGALGLGAVKDSLIGSVCERVVRRIKVDTLVVKNTLPLEEQTGNILVAVDGSPQSFAGLRSAIEMGRAFNKPVEAVAVYDPYLHYAMFNSIVGVLTEKASKVFKFKEQEQLHEEVIDTGLAKIYQSHLEIARSVAKEEGVDLKITLLDGKAFEKILKYVRKEKPWLLVMGRIGVHSEDDMDIGSNTENLLRMVPCNVYLSSKKFIPPIDIKAEASVNWTEEALRRMDKVPAMVRGIARTAILRYAMERGHSIISSSVIDDTMRAVLPEGMVRAMGLAAETVAIEKGKLNEGTTYICRYCGYAAKNVLPVVCPVCRAKTDQFEKVDKATIESLAPLEGGVEEEETFDGIKLSWTGEAKELLRTVPTGYMKRRAKARIEKQARVRKLTTITKDMAAQVIEQTLEEDRLGRDPESPAEQGENGDGHNEVPGGNGDRQTAPSSKTNGNVTDGELVWTEDAVERLNRVPAGFMRNITKDKIEGLTREKGTTRITLELTEAGIEVAKKIMEEAISSYAKGNK
jgi:nucleotide-binding universal stress UspA family protein